MKMREREREVSNTKREGEKVEVCEREDREE